MKLSLVFELLLIFVLLAFAASKSVRKQKDKKGVHKKEIQNKNSTTLARDDSLNKYCKCSDELCNCCRDFQVPVVNLAGPGCAALRYIKGDKMSVSLSFGKKVITNRILSKAKPSPVCMPLPGRISKFCGRVYNIARVGEDFRACLGLELQSKNTVEAAVRVSCFKFGPRGITSEPADPLPLVPQDENIDEDDDDDEDEDDLGLGGDDEDDDDEDDDDDGELAAVNDVESADYTGFSILGDDLLGDLFGSTGGKNKKKQTTTQSTVNKNKKKQAPLPSSTSPTTTRRPRPTRRRTTRNPIRSSTPSITATKTTTVRTQSNSRRPTRRPSRRPNRPRPTRRTTPVSNYAEVTTQSSQSIPSPVTLFTSILSSIENNTTTVRNDVYNDINETLLEPVDIVSQKPSSTFLTSTDKMTSTEKIMTQDPLEMSFAHITDQLSNIPVTETTHPDNKYTDIMSSSKDQTSYEKIETITHKAPFTTPITSTSETVINDDMVQIVENLDSHSGEKSTENYNMKIDQSRAILLDPSNNGLKFATNNYEGLRLPKKKHKNNGISLDDLDVIGLTDVGETIGDQLGLFNRHKRNNKENNNTKMKNMNKDNEDYADLFNIQDLGETFGLSRKDSRRNRRQNKMMRGEWSTS